jgi:hypothetical protein
MILCQSMATTGWRHWFAWYPVNVGEYGAIKLVWWQPVECMEIDEFDNGAYLYWVYREIRS